MEKRRRACSTLLRLVIKLCNCSAAKGAEYFTTPRYSWPCTNSFSATARTPGLRTTAERQLLHGAFTKNRGRNLGAGLDPAHTCHFTQFYRLGQSRPGTFVHHQRDRMSHIDLSSDPACGMRASEGGEFLAVSHIAAIEVMAQAQTMFPVQNVTEALT